MSLFFVRLPSRFLTRFLRRAAAMLAAGIAGWASCAVAQSAPSNVGELQVAMLTPSRALASIDASLAGLPQPADADERRRLAFVALNAARRAAGAGLVVQSFALDKTATNHAAYLAGNGIGTAWGAHAESAGWPGYTGADPFVRMRAAGYDFSFATEVIGEIGSSSPQSDCVGDLLNTIYHAADLLGRVTHAGIGFGSGDAAGLCTIDLASARGRGAEQLPPSGAVIAYPYNGQTVGSGTFYIANESPRASAALLPNSVVGTPVLVGLRNRDYVASGGAMIAQLALADASGQPVSAVILADPAVHGANVIADAQLHSGFVALVPTHPLPAGRYTVTLQAMAGDGRPLAQSSWAFDVAAQ